MRCDVVVDVVLVFKPAAGYLGRVCIGAYPRVQGTESGPANHRNTGSSAVLGAPASGVVGLPWHLKPCAASGVRT